ncbi:endonuclease domain-containing 1 protein-like [Platysternon megacephalum]|uniref:Endonuclease domain-containing 1 protein-like n=1 Tax=Platysternon megacephalum TaxID=55544 RepID=A0A4D9DQP1_9SAUR|nr:endonuclease domain-containing 1 protein-like [Platysternon megacephalum]
MSPWSGCPPGSAGVCSLWAGVTRVVCTGGPRSQGSHPELMQRKPSPEPSRQCSRPGSESLQMSSVGPAKESLGQLLGIPRGEGSCWHPAEKGQVRAMTLTCPDRHVTPPALPAPQCLTKGGGSCVVTAELSSLIVMGLAGRLYRKYSEM